MAKPYPVVGHLVDSAMVCGSVWDHLLAEGQRSRVVEALGVDVLEARRIVMFWAGLHDLGKIIPSFQRMLLKARPARSGFLSEAAYAHDRRADSTVGRIRHESATHAALPQLLARLGYPAARGSAGEASGSTGGADPRRASRTLSRGQRPTGSA
ncbi:CRISPR-associated endonuclease Cas3'' [Streptomyces sp. GKU 257-1]|nr:CRISPR-associated endonuclease Cas3'' [Streptomyces sp. GKU 257-1]